MKEFLSYVRPYKKEAFLAIFCILSETVFELVIPLVMASIVDVGVANAVFNIFGKVQPGSRGGAS